MGRALGVALIAFVASCYQSPSLASCKYRCGGANNNTCPTGYACTDGMCVAPGEGCDGDGGVIDAPPDGGDDATDAPIDAAICTNPGAFTWEKKASLQTMTALSQLVALDANNDDDMDLVVLDAANGIGFFPGNGDGTFGARVGSTVGANARRVITGDFDRDQQDDDVIVLRGVPTPLLAVLASNGNGMFTQTEVTLSTDQPIDIANAGDLDGNTFDDVVVLYSVNAPRLDVRAQVTTSPFWGAGATTPTNGNATRVHMGLANADALPDAVLTIPGENQFGVQVGVSGQPYDFDGIVEWNVNTGPAGAVTGELRSSGVRSVVTANATADNVSIRNSVGGTTFNGTDNPTVGGSPRAVILVNIGGSALLDIVTADNATNTISVLINQDGSFAPVALTNVDQGPVDLVSADFDGDQRMDLAVATPGANSVSILLNKCPP